MKKLRRKLKITSFISNSEEETKKIGRKFADLLLKKLSAGMFSGGITVMLIGELGAGKTCFVKGAAASIAPDRRVTSPSYILINEYSSKPVKLVHADLYRMNSSAEVEYTGLYEYPGPNTVLMVEWPEKIMDDWQKYICLRIRKKCRKTRELEFTARGKEERSILEEWKNNNDSGH